MIEVNKSTVIDGKMIKESQQTEENGIQCTIATIARQRKYWIWLHGNHERLYNKFYNEKNVKNPQKIDKK